MKKITSTAIAGTIMTLAAKHGIEVPVNTMYYQKIKEIEAEYS